LYLSFLLQALNLRDGEPQIHEPRAHDAIDGRDWSSPDLRGSTYVPSFGAVEYTYPLTDRVHAFTLAQGLLVITAALPTAWKVRFADENMCRADADNFPWASGVLVSGTRIQRRRSEDT
jgi:hypothetical protein